ncbi:MAG TPA: ectoine/hydroxyectoine ABC transporter ATP-binding protein EhuA [Candidatus Dormibacteraeota bacterium]|jgi:polar amino acid transport system ATP-binding protein|nr:ectoine/hydroxyectoine ABC transporter ATP-binding protein EhuA [Candidatus Dormibacteraeota bacterium]
MNEHSPAPDGVGDRRPVLRMADVCKAFGARVVADHLDLEVAPGEKIAIIGPSGSGKTTVLRLAIGLERPDSGLIEIDGDYLWHERRGDEVVPSGERHARQVRRAMGMVFQHFNLFPHMTALQNVTEPLAHTLRLPKSEVQGRAVELLTEVGLGEHLHQRPAQLSGGQQQRVAIARSLALHPRVMLFDEVTSALDPELVGEVLRVIRELAHNTSMAMLLVTHEISFARDIADRVVMFDGGRIVEQGTPDDVLRNPQSPRTQQFLRAIVER